MEKNTCLHKYTIKRLHIYSIFILFLSAGQISAQQLTPFVVSPSGGFYSNTSGMLSFTTGEMTAIETFTSSENILTQGFQQIWDFGTYITEHPNLNFSFGIYPNPSDGYFNLVTETEENVHVVVKILDVLGKEILHSEFYQQNNINIQPFDFSHVAAGLYVISLSLNEGTSGTDNHYVSKIQIF